MFDSGELDGFDGMLTDYEQLEEIIANKICTGSPGRLYMGRAHAQPDMLCILPEMGIAISYQLRLRDGVVEFELGHATF